MSNRGRPARPHICWTSIAEIGAWTPKWSSYRVVSRTITLPRGQVDSRGQGRGRNERLQRPVAERLLDDPALGVRQGRVVERDPVREGAGRGDESPRSPPRRRCPSSSAAARAAARLLGGQSEARTVGPSACAVCSLARRRVDEDERLAAPPDHVPHESWEGVTGRRDVPGREVREQDPSVVVDPALQRNGAELARDVAGLQPVGDLRRVADRGGEGDHLKVGDQAAQPSQATPRASVPGRGPA